MPEEEKDEYKADNDSLKRIIEKMKKPKKKKKKKDEYKADNDSLKRIIPKPQ